MLWLASRAEKAWRVWFLFQCTSIIFVWKYFFRQTVWKYIILPQPSWQSEIMQFHFFINYKKREYSQSVCFHANRGRFVVDALDFQMMHYLPYSFFFLIQIIILFFLKLSNGQENKITHVTHKKLEMQTSSIRMVMKQGLKSSGSSDFIHFKNLPALTHAKACLCTLWESSQRNFEVCFQEIYNTFTVYILGNPQDQASASDLRWKGYKVSGKPLSHSHQTAT